MTSYTDAIHQTDILAVLAPFDPHVVGTLPLGLALPDSDIDIVCHAPDRTAIAEVIWRHFGTADDFAIYQWSAKGRPVIATFMAEGWPLEIFASDMPVMEQAGWQHFRIEQRLLSLAGFAFRDALMSLRRKGMKTEPAFAGVLGLSGDPYQALSELFGATDGELAEIIAMRPACRMG